MKTIQRISPVSFSARPVAAETRNHWRIIREYEGEGDGPWLIDLSHATKWDVQDGNPDEIRPGDAVIPPKPGETVITGNRVISRMNRTQASVWQVSEAETDSEPAPLSPAFTEVTEFALMLALIGKDVFRITEKLTALDLADPRKKTPCLFQGPFSHVPCQVVVAEKSGTDGALLLACSRGYGQDMVHAILEAGDEFGLRPGGAAKFDKWLETQNSD